MDGSPLSGIKVLDLASVGPAARTSRWLADYGALVVKVGPPPRKSGVQIVPPFYAYGGHRGMQRAAIDLKAPAGREAFLRLAADADVVIESFRPGVIDRLGLGYADLAAVNPGVILCSTTGYGQAGPRSQWAGHDLNYLAVGGYLDCSGRDATGAPALPGASIADSAGGGMQAVIAVLAALVQRATTGKGTHLDVSIADGVLSLMSLYVDEYLATGTVPGPGHNILTGRLACYGIYRCADDRYVAVGAIEPQFFANLCRALGCEQWIPHQADDDQQDAIRADLAAAFARRDRDDWVAELGPADTCVSAVATVPELTADPGFTSRQAFVTAHRPGHDDFPQVGWVLAGMDRGQAEPVIGEPANTDTDDLLQAAGYDADAIAALRAEGAIA
ncbi:MAG TPA: CaiB/BaiF CoA-transferase family protein [Acidimicrobiales bacterium]